MRSKIGLIIIVFIIIVLFGIIVIQKKENQNEKGEYFKIITTTKIDNSKKEYIGLSNNYLYYLNGYNINDVYVLRSKESKTLNDSLIDEALKYLKQDKYSFSINKEEYIIDNLFNSLYIQDNGVFIDLLDLEKKYDFITKEENHLKITDFEIKETKNDKYKLVGKNNNSSLYTKGLELISVEISGEKKNGINDLIKSYINLDELFASIGNKYESLMEYKDIDDLIISENVYRFNKEKYLVIEIRKNDNGYLDYYYQLENKKETQGRLGIEDE